MDIVAIIYWAIRDIQKILGEATLIIQLVREG